MSLDEMLAEEGCSTALPLLAIEVLAPWDPAWPGRAEGRAVSAGRRAARVGG